MNKTKSSLLAKVKEYALPIILSVAALMLIAYYIFKLFATQFYEANINGFKELFGVALTILGSGIFLAVLKWFQFMGFFREELNNIISSSEFEKKLENTLYSALYSESFLKKQNDVDVLWKRVNKVLFKNQFPDELAEKIEQRMQEAFFNNSKLSHYYKNYVYTIHVDLDENDYLIIKEIAEAKIIRQEESTFQFPYTYFIQKNGPDDNVSGIEFNSLKADDNFIDLTKCETVTNTDTRQSKRIMIELEGKKEYDIVSEITLTYNLNVDHEYQLYCERFIDYLRVEIAHSPKIRVIFLTIGNEDFTELRKGDQNFVKTFTGLLLPEKGFRLIFVKA